MLDREPPPLLRVVVADDHPVVLSGLVAFLDQQEGLTVVGQRGDATQLGEESFDVAVVDVRMPGVTPATVAALAERGAVVLFTRNPRGDHIAALLEAGARGLVSKDAPLETLASAVRAVADGGTFLPEREVRPHEQLSGRERAVFDALIRGRRPKEIAFDLELSLSTVYTYAERVRKKLELEDVRELVAYAHREGLLDDGS